MAIGDPFGALDAEPEEDWRYKEAIDGLKNDPSQQPQQPASSWYDTLNDVAHFPHRIIGALTAPRQDTPPGRLTVLRNVADIVGPTLKNAFTAPHRVMTGELDPESPKGTSAALDMALLGGASVAGALERGAASPGVDLRILGKKVLSDSAPTAAPIALAEHAQPFYSGLEHAVNSVPQGSMSGQQWLGTLANKAGVKPEELDWAGARDMLTANADKPVTKAQLQDHLDANKVQLGEVTKEHMPESWKDVPGDIQYKLADMHRDNYFDGRYGGAPDLPDWYENIAQHSMKGNETGIDDFFNPPRFTEHTLPGGKNYREKLLTLPARPSTPEEILDRAKKEVKLQYPEDSFEDLPEPIRNGYLKFGEQLQPSSYKSPHWEERNVLGHLRMTDRDVAGSAPVDAEAAKAFSDHQAQLEALRDQQGAVGRQIGAAAKPLEAARQAKLKADYASGKLTGPQFQQQSMSYVDHPDLAPLQDKLQQLRAAEDELRKSAPPQPQPDIKPALHVEEAQSDWHQNGRELGYDGDTSTWVAKPSEGGSFWKVETKNGKKLGSASGVKTPEEAIAKVAESVPPIPSAPFKSTPAWSSLLMKRALHEAAATGKTRISWTPGEAHPTNPKNIGRAGEEADAADRGMQAFYNKMLPDLMNKIGKPHGVSVQKGLTEVGKPDSLQLDRMRNGVYRVIDTANRGAQVGPQFRSAAEARAWIDTSGATKQPVHYMDIPESLRHQLLTKGMPLFEDSSAAAPIAAAQHIGEGNVARARPGVGGGNPGLEEAQRTAARLAGSVKPLRGLPDKPITVGGSSYVPGPNERIHGVAKQYMESTGRPYQRADAYHPVDVEHAKAIAKAYEEMQHAPNDPKVRASYEAMAKETRAQYRALKKSGLKIEAIEPGMPDPYAESPRLAQKDVAENNHLWFFPTESGFGTEAAGSSHPLLEKSGEKLGGRDLLNNDLFRIVHDYFGHMKEGNGFRAAGEDNAWRTHALMYSDKARPAMTTETRGQNSWLNYGPHGEFNRTASAADTHYAQQKAGLLPDWVMHDRPRPSEAMPRDPNDLPAAGAKYPQYAETYPPVGPPQLSDKATGKPIDAKGKAAQKLIDDGKAYWAKQNTPEATAFQKDRNAIQKEMDAKGYDPFFPPEERSHVDPANHPTSLDMTRDALPAKQETVEKYRKMFNTPAARARLQKAFDEGKKLGNAKDWYAMRQLEDQYVKHLGPEEGRKRFANEFAHTMAATTGGADPTSNLLLAHYVQWASRHGGIPEASHQLPFPIGGRYVSNNIKQFQKMPEEGGFTEANPKRHDFGHAFLGHANKATMDEQMSGGLVPGMQIPPGDSYGVAAQVVHDLAKKNGVTPRDFQDITWAGLKKMKVGDKFKYKGPMIQDVNDAIERTHRLTGMPRNEIVRRGVVKKEIPLYSNPAPLGALDAEQDRSP